MTWYPPYPGARPNLLLGVFIYTHDIYTALGVDINTYDIYTALGVDIYTYDIYTALGVDIYTHGIYTALGVDISSDPHPGPAPPCSCSRECVPAAGCLILVPTLATRSQAPGVSTSHTHTHADKQTIIITFIRSLNI